MFVDTAPVMEKPLAAAAGLGWQGKHTNLVSREFGSWLFLGAIFTELELPPDEAESDHCGTCRACLDICPTRGVSGALPARRAPLHLLSDDRAQGPDRAASSAPPIGNRIYGCDDCLAVCPWNKFAANAREAKLIARDDLRSRRRSTSSPRSTTRASAERFAGGPIKRIGHARFLRNVLIAIGNSGKAIACADRRRGASIMTRRWCAPWPSGRSAASATRVRKRLSRANSCRRETDENVVAEWRYLDIT